jgi:hypothetical protein
MSARPYTKGRKGRMSREGQAGIISCIATSPSAGGLMAAGSYGRTTAVYHEVKP